MINPVNKKFDVVLALDLCVDFLIALGSTLPEFGQKEKLIPDYHLTLGGSAVLTASQLTKLGLRVAGIGAVGEDLFGDFILQQLTDLQISTQFIQQDANLKTGMGLALCQPHDRAILTYTGSIDALTHFPENMLQNARHLHSSSYFLTPSLQANYPKIFQTARQHGMTTSLDPNFDPAEQWQSGLPDLLPFLDLLFVNETEALGMSGKPDLNDARTWLTQRVPVVVLKQGANGASVFTKTAILHEKALQVDVIDAVGAGDNFNGGFLYGFLNAMDWATCLRLGVACGSASTTRAGGIAGQIGKEALILKL
jgi:sugar/nucleoside kinase (ribokinase family)